ncbi:hypothetical protein TELCIR_04499 [Teladorsagia circumcincta]|uniref:Uncharacterized protein n=1 Tax=Teladorsagia circumcincta TaxID=45464 RepID=A0A2G9UTF7_TELCI|nr:hypothetical protein TELCIR_04499 [Teladorsagia circumcincta]
MNIMKTTVNNKVNHNGREEGEIWLAYSSKDYRSHTWHRLIADATETTWWPASTSWANLRYDFKSGDNLSFFSTAKFQDMSLIVLAVLVAVATAQPCPGCGPQFFAPPPCFNPPCAPPPPPCFSPPCAPPPPPPMFFMPPPPAPCYGVACAPPPPPPPQIFYAPPPPPPCVGMACAPPPPCMGMACAPPPPPPQQIIFAAAPPPPPPRIMFQAPPPCSSPPCAPPAFFNPPCSGFGCGMAPPPPPPLFGSVPCCSMMDFSCCRRLFRKRQVEQPEKVPEEVEETTQTEEKKRS